MSHQEERAGRGRRRRKELLRRARAGIAAHMGRSQLQARPAGPRTACVLAYPRRVSEFSPVWENRRHK